MSFEVRMMYFSKRLNSTLRPPRDGGTEYDCVLKDGSGLVSPVITLNLGLINPPTGFNYCYIPAFNRYYRVREWFFNDALWSAQLDCDVLVIKTRLARHRFMCYGPQVFIMIMLWMKNIRCLQAQRIKKLIRILILFRHLALALMLLAFYLAAIRQPERSATTQ